MTPHGDQDDADLLDPVLNAEALAEAERIKRASLGDRIAFARLVEDNYNFIYRTAYKWCGNQSDAEDLAQDVCVKLASALSGFTGRSSFKSWLYRITLNAVYDLHRKKSRQAKRHRAFGWMRPDVAPATQEAETIENELWRAVRQLPDKQRDAVLLIYAEELTHAAAAVILDVKESTVSWYVHEAKKTLKGLL